MGNMKHRVVVPERRKTEELSPVISVFFLKIPLIQAGRWNLKHKTPR